MKVSRNTQKSHQIHQINIRTNHTKHSSTELVAEVSLQVTLGADVLDVSTVLEHTLVLLQPKVLLLVDVGEAPLAADNDLLAARELVASTAESLHDDGRVGFLGTDGEDDLADVNTGDSAVGLAPCTTHTGLETIRSGTGQHLVDANNVEGVDTDTQVERILSGSLRHVLVGANTGGFQSLRRQLFILIRDQVGAEGEVIDRGTLTAKIENSDLGVGDTTIVPRLGVRLVLAVAIAASGTATHC